MIRVDVGPRLSRSARKLGDQITTEVEERLTLVSRHFGEPHRHSGIGLRKLGRRSYEARVSRGLRIVFIREPDRLTAYDLMDHAQVAQWLRARKGDSDPALTAAACASRFPLLREWDAVERVPTELDAPLTRSISARSGIAEIPTA